MIKEFLKVYTPAIAFLVLLCACLILTSSCGKAPADGSPGVVGATGEPGLPGASGPKGTDAKPTSSGGSSWTGSYTPPPPQQPAVPAFVPVEICPDYDVSQYPEEFTENAVCIFNKLYSVHWKGNTSFFVEVFPGNYFSLDPAGCKVTVAPDCEVTHERE